MIIYKLRTQQQQIHERAPGFDQIRFNLCVKLVFRHSNHVLSNPQHVDVFKHSVKDLYKIVTQLEAEIREERRREEYI